MRFTRTSIAAAVTIAALGVLAAVALASGGTQTTSAPAPSAETDPPAQTVQRTNQPVRAASSDDDGTADQGPGDAPRTPVAPARDAGHDVDNSGPGSTSSGRGGNDDGPNHDDGAGHTQTTSSSGTGGGGHSGHDD